MNTLERGVQCEYDKSFSNRTPNKMDYRQKMVVAPQQKLKNEDDDEDDLEALRLAALQSLRTKDAAHSRKQPPTQLHKIVPQFTQISRPPYKVQRPPRRGYFHNRLQQRQNGNLYYQSPRNPNLIAIVPVDEHSVLQQMQLPCPTKVEKTDSSHEAQSVEVSKFNRFKDNGSCSEEEDAKDNSKTGTVTKKDDSRERDSIAKGVERTLETDDNKESATESLQKNEDEQDAEEVNDDDDDILLMADLEEEDSLERLMDEMEREMNVDKPTEKREKRSSKRESREGGAKTEPSQQKNTTIGAQEQRLPTNKDDIGKKDVNESVTAPAPSMTFSRNERRSVSPHTISRVSQKRRSLSPKLRSRKKSPRRSPRRSPIRQPKKSQREMTRYRSPRMSPPRYSPRQRSPLPSRLSPRPRSPLRLSPPPPMRRSPPRGRSPRHSPPLSRISSRSKSPRPPRSRSPRLQRSRSPRFSPITRLTPRRSRSPRSKSPMRGSPCRRSRSPLGPGSPRTNRSKSPPSRRSPPRRSSPRRGAQAIGSPSRRSPWSSPRNSPRVSPRRRRSPARWSPKEVSRKLGPARPRSSTPDASARRECSPLPVKSTRSSSRQENFEEKGASMASTVLSSSATTTTTISSSAALTASGVNLNSSESGDVAASSVIGTDPILEARRRKFESTRPIDPINANKKIKLNKKEEQPNKKTSAIEGQVEVLMGGARRTTGTTVVAKTDDAYVVEDADLTMDASSYEYDEDELDEVEEDVTSVPLTATVNTACVETIEPSSVLKPAEKDRTSKKKKKRDKEIYQVGKLKSELPLSERIGKDKKCKKRKDVIVTADNSREDVEAIFEDINVDEEGDLRAELSRRRAERLNRTVPIQSARLVQSAFKGVVNEVVKNNAKVNQRHVIKTDEKPNQKDVRRVTVLHRTVSDLHDSEEETPLDSKVPVRFRLGLNKQAQDNREPKATRKTSKRQGRKVKHKSNLSVTDPEQIL